MRAWLRDVVAGFLDHNCSLHAAGLTYFALLAIVPVLCCILVAAKACHVDEMARSAIDSRIDAVITEIENGQDSRLVDVAGTLVDDPGRSERRTAARAFASKARKISDELFTRVESFDVGTLGWVGFGFLLWTVISSLASVETSFNEIFGVEKPRPILRRAWLYLFIMVALPILATVAMSLPILKIVKEVLVATMGSLWLTKWVSDGLVWLLDSSLVRFVWTLFTGSVAFGFFLWVMPNCKVRIRHAWFGGLLTALLFGAWMKVCAVAQVGLAKSSALYGSFAFLPIVLTWLYVSWQIVLLGANIVNVARASSPLQERKDIK